MTNPTHPAGSMGATIETALAESKSIWWQTPPRLDLAASAVVSAFAEGAKQLLASGDGDGLVAVPSEWDCSHGTADDEAFCQELDQDEHPECPTIRVHRDDAERFAAMVDMLHELRNHVAELENGPATFYRARRVVGERGDTLGHYRTREQAQARCIAELRAKSTLVPDVIFSWVGVDGTEVLGVSTPAEPCPDVTDYVVTEVTVSGTAADEGSVR